MSLTPGMEGLSLDVGGVEYAFTRLPTSVPAGTTLTFTNEGVEIHEMIVNRLADGVTESFEELLALTARLMSSDGQRLTSGPDVTTLEALRRRDPLSGDGLLRPAQ